MRKRTVGRGIYAISAVLIAGIIILTMLPAFFSGAHVLYGEVPLRVVHAFTSLAVALLLFGVLGDSEAIIKNENTQGFYIQVGGSAAGFVVFFYLISSGLSSNASLTVTLVDLQDEIVRDEVRLEVIGSTLQSAETSKGFVDFSYLPKVDDSRRLSILSRSGISWRISDMRPNSCQLRGSVINGSCEKIELILEPKEICLTNTRTIDVEGSNEIQTTLATKVQRLFEKLQMSNPSSGFIADFSPAIRGENAHEFIFGLQRKIDTERNACEHINAILNSFNNAYRKRKVVAYESCNKIYIMFSEENLPEEMKQCGK